MTIKQYLVHLWYWVCSFPTWKDVEHTLVGRTGENKLKCLLCDYEEEAEE